MQVELHLILFSIKFNKIIIGNFLQIVYIDLMPDKYQLFLRIQC